MPIAPFLVTPRLDTKPWGGARLQELGFTVEGPEPLGEVVMTATANRVGAGPDAGRSVGELIAADPIGVIGRRGLTATGGRGLFPLLVKLIDAAEPLSIQVHPDDRRGAAVDSLGKTEAWHILAAEPGASYFAGLHEGAGVADLEAAARGEPGATTRHIRRLPARAGESVFLPAGTLHALGAGVLLYELQQASEITYRLDDWGRTGADGQPRKLHVAESLEAIDPAIRPEILVPIPVAPTGVERHLLVACRYFALDRFRVAIGETARLAADDTAQTVTVVRGAIDLHWAGQSSSALRVAVGETAIVPAATAVVEAVAVEPAELLRAWVPDLATEVVAPALAAGVSWEALTALSAPLPDVADAIRSVDTG